MIWFGHKNGISDDEVKKSQVQSVLLSIGLKRKREIMGWHVKGDEISREYCGDLFVEDYVIENTSEGKK